MASPETVLHRPRRAEASPRPLPAELITALRRAHAAELIAVGDQRRPAFRLTRALLGGARLAGYSSTRLAVCMGVSVDSVRTRGGSDGWISGEVFAELAGLAAGAVDGWSAAGLLSERCVDEAGRDCYRASELVRALGRTGTTAGSR